jgi:hypothetical protein
MVAQPRVKFFQAHYSAFIGVHAVEESFNALRVGIRKGGQGCEFLEGEFAVLACDFGEALSALCFDFGPDCGARCGPFFVRELAVAIGVPLGDPIGVLGGPGFLDGLALFLVNATIFIGVELLKKFGQVVTKAAVTGTDAGNSETKGEAEDREVFKFHGSGFLLRGLVFCFWLSKGSVLLLALRGVRRRAVRGGYIFRKKILERSTISSPWFGVRGKTALGR